MIGEIPAHPNVHAKVAKEVLVFVGMAATCVGAVVKIDQYMPNPDGFAKNALLGVTEAAAGGAIGLGLFFGAGWTFKCARNQINEWRVKKEQDRFNRAFEDLTANWSSPDIDQPNPLSLTRPELTQAEIDQFFNATQAEPDPPPPEV